MEASKLRDRLYPGAERSTFVWTETDTLSRVAEAGCGVHILQKASHYVHVDNRTTLESFYEDRRSYRSSPDEVQINSDCASHSSDIENIELFFSMSHTLLYTNELESDPTPLFILAVVRHVGHSLHFATHLS